MSTNESFIKAYRHDVARPATPAPARVRPAAEPTVASPLNAAPIVAAQSVPAWHTTIEIAAAHYAPATAIIASAIEAPPSRSTEGPPIRTIETQPLRPVELPVRPAQHPPISRPKILSPSIFPTAAPPATAPPTALPPTPTPHPSTPIIGKRPLSSFQPPELRPQPTRPTRPTSTTTAPPRPTIFTPETIISAFRWPSICRTLWEEYAIEYERVAEKLVDTSRAGRPIVGVTSINAGDGCTTSLLCLAVALAARKMRIALVDASFQDPQLADLLGAKVNTSWSTVLDRGLPVAEAMIRATEDKIDLLPLDGDHRFAGHEAADLVAGMQTAVTAGVLRSSYDIVLVDLGPLLAPGAYAALSNLLRLMPIQSALVVANPRNADANDAAVVGELLEEDGCELLGVIENRARPIATRMLSI